MNYNPLRNETDPDNQRKKEIYRDLLQGILFYLIFASAFASITESPKSYGGNQCVVLLGWGKAASFYLTFGFIIFCFVNPILACTMPSIRNYFSTSPEWIFQNLLYYIRLFMYTWGAIIFLGLIVALGYDENCKDLTSETSFFIFVVIIILIIIGLCYCFVLKEEETIYQNPDEKPQQDYGTMQNQEQNQQDNKKQNQETNQEKKQEQDEEEKIKLVVDDQKQQQQFEDDPDKRDEKPTQEMDIPK